MLQHESKLSEPIDHDEQVDPPEFADDDQVDDSGRRDNQIPVTAVDFLSDLAANSEPDLPF